MNRRCPNGKALPVPVEATDCTYLAIGTIEAMRRTTALHNLCELRPPGNNQPTPCVATTWSHHQQRPRRSVSSLARRALPPAPIALRVRHRGRQAVLDKPSGPSSIG